MPFTVPQQPSVFVNKFCNNNRHIVPGWNDQVKDLHVEAWEAYILWCHLGEPRQGPLSNLMRTTRLSFKCALRQCRKHEERAKAEALAKDLECKDDRSFWRKVSRMNNSKMLLPSSINDCQGESEIMNM